MAADTLTEDEKENKKRAFQRSDSFSLYRIKSILKEGGTVEERAQNENVSYAYDFSKYQEHRLNFVPVVPKSLDECCEKKMTLKEEQFPIANGLEDLFPTLSSR